MKEETTLKRTKQMVLAALILIPLIYTPSEKIDDFYYEPKVFVMFLLIVTYLVVLLKNRKQLNVLIYHDKINITLMVYFLLLFISLFFARDKYYAIIGYPYRLEGISTILMYMLLFLAARTVKKPGRIFFKGAILTACVVAIYGIAQYYGLDPFPRDHIRENWVGRSFSTIGNPNFLGSYLVLMIPLSMHLFIVKKKNYAFAVFGVLFYCLLCTMTRGAWLGIIASITSYFAFLWFYRSKYINIFPRSLWILIFSFVLILGFALQSESEFLRRILSIVDVVDEGVVDENAGSGRIFIWKRVVELIAMKPWFGHGIENLAIPFSELYKEDMIRNWGRVLSISKTHNEYLHIAVSSGIPSLIVYLFFVIMVLKRGLKRLQNEPYILPIMAAILGYLIQAFFNISVVSVAYIYWIFLGILASESHR